MRSPPASSSIASSTSTCADSTMIAVPGSSARITRAACSPSVACPGGIRMSMTASSGRRRTDQRQQLRAASPAWPTTSNPDRSSRLASALPQQHIVIGQHHPQRTLAPGRHLRYR